MREVACAPSLPYTTAADVLRTCAVLHLWARAALGITTVSPPAMTAFAGRKAKAALAGPSFVFLAEVAATIVIAAPALSTNGPASISPVG